jgi:glycosyltransferase involved in cell wall biosynthesis
VRIAISVFNYLSKDDGTTVRAKRVFNALAEHFETTLVALKSGREDRQQAQIIYISVSWARQCFQIPAWLAGLFRVLLAKRFDAVFCSNDWFGFIVVYLLSLMYRYPVVFEAHGILSEEYHVWGRSKMVVGLAKLLERFVVKRSSVVVALSQRIFDFYRQYNKHIELVPVFIDTERYQLDARRRDELRQKYKVSGKLVGLIGPFDSRWNEHALEFLGSNLPKFDESITFMAIGKYSRRKPERTIQRRVIYTGYVNDYVEHLSCLDAVVVPSKLPTSGPCNKILESMSLSLPVFTTNQGAVGLDYVQHSKEIFITEEVELPALINRLIFDDELMHTVGNNGHQTVIGFYSTRTNSERLVKLVKALL